MTDKILGQREGRVGHIIFNNPERHNAVSLDMWEAVGRLLDDYLEDDEIRVIVVSGAGGKAFVSGADISKFESERSTQEAVVHYNSVTKASYSKLYNASKPTIAMVRGYCIGGGLALSCCCDMRIATTQSKFGLPAAKLALGYPFEGLRRLVNIVGTGFAREICITAKRFTADEAHIMGLVNRVVADDALEDTVNDYAQSIAENAPLTVDAMKYIFNEIAKDARERDLDRCQSMVDACFDSDDYIEGRRAFMEKRTPQFKGA